MIDSSGSGAEDILRSLDNQIDKAVTNKDAATLETILADDYVYTHSNGRHQSKREYIDAVAQKEKPPRRALSDIEVELHDDIAITRGNLDTVEDDDESTAFFMRYVRVYRLTD